MKECLKKEVLLNNLTDKIKENRGLKQQLIIANKTIESLKSIILKTADFADRASTVKKDIFEANHGFRSISEILAQAIKEVEG